MSGGQFWGMLALVVVTTTVCLFALRPLAARVGWVDRPSLRKRHDGAVPLIGGIAIFVGMLIGVAFYAGWLNRFELALFGTAAVIAVVGAIDDRLDLSPRLRLLIQIIVILVMVEVSGVRIHTLGTYFGYNFSLGWAGVPVTVIAVAGLLNAFNMMDGLDGLAGMLGLVSIAFITMFGGDGQSGNALLIISMMGIAIIPYLAFNLGVVGKRNRVFMGDAGSMTLGYVIAWSLIYSSQKAAPLILPATVLWFVALPVMDALTVMAGRMLMGRSPLSPGRGHIHHILLRMGFGPRWALVVLVGAAIVMAVVGKSLEEVSETASLILFVVLGLSYAVVRIVTLRALNDEEQGRYVPAAIPKVVAAKPAVVSTIKPNPSRAKAERSPGKHGPGGPHHIPTPTMMEQRSDDRYSRHG